MRVYFSKMCYWRIDDCSLAKSSGETIILTPKQNNLLRTLVTCAGRVVNHENLKKSIWGEDYADNVYKDFDKHLRQHIQNLRDMDESLEKCIINVRGHGYMFESPEDLKEENDKVIYAMTSEKSMSHTQLRFEEENKKNIRHVTLEELVSLGISIEDAAKAIVENDKALYGDLGADDNEGTPATWEKFMEANSRSFQFLINEENQIVGNFSYVALSQAQVCLCKNGNIQEAKFTPRNTEYLLHPHKKAFDGFLLNFSCNVLFTSIQNNGLLFNAFCEDLLVYAKSGLFFKGFYVNIFRDDHFPMYESFGFKYVTKNKPHGTIYYLDLQDPSTFAIGWWEKQKELITLYHERFSITKE